MTRRRSAREGDPRSAYRRRRITLGVVLGLIGLTAAGVGLAIDRFRDEPGAEGGPAAQTDKKTMWGPITLPNGKSIFPTFRDLGVGIYATQVHWDQTAPKQRPEDPTDPKDPAYTWPAYVDYAVKEANKQGIKVLIQLIGTPPWANGGKAMEWAPDKASDFADFAVAVSRRYPQVRHWMIWGEPNRGPNFQPLTPAKRDIGPLSKAEQVAPRRYSELLDAAYEALKTEREENLLVGGNTYTSAGPGDVNTYQWIEYMRLPDGSRPRMDMYGHNPYGFRKPNLNDPPSRRGTVAFADLERLAEALDEAYPDQELPLYLSEWGVPIGYHDDDLTYSLDAESGVKWIRAGFKIARDWDRVYSLGWVHPVDTPYSSQGLLDKQGERKPSYDAYKGS